VALGFLLEVDILPRRILAVYLFLLAFQPLVLRHFLPVSHRILTVLMSNPTPSSLSDSRLLA
jgi:hypothetical protein